MRGIAWCIELKLSMTCWILLPTPGSVGAPPRALRTGKSVVFQARRAAWVHPRIFSSSIELKLLYTPREGVPSTSSVGAPPRALRTGKGVVFQVRRAAQGFELNYRPSLPTISPNAQHTTKAAGTTMSGNRTPLFEGKRGETNKSHSKDLNKVMNKVFQKSFT